MVLITLWEIFFYLQPNSSLHRPQVKENQQPSGEKGHDGDKQLPQRFQLAPSVILQMFIK